MITGLYETEHAAVAAITALEAEGFNEERISIIAGENVNRDAFAVSSHSKLAEGTALGATTGGAVGALVVGLTAVGTIATGGLGLLAAGPIVAALAGAGAGAATGGVIGGAIGSSLPEHEIKAVESALERGSVLIGVECENSDEQSRVKSILKETGAERMSTA